ncbi:uncharacterized protein G2W53_028988 [Senna tora]|uniref:Uncharacterized protein n=1 Tax=Senna tora TaxID=362788 RepID=A0A834T3C6_9FABA|nr:uncharacterized protein G2W53_028988 [Senna tora]
MDDAFTACIYENANVCKEANGVAWQQLSKIDEHQ